ALIAKIAIVHAGIIAVVGLEMAARVIDRLRPRERVEQIESVAEALLDLGLQGVVGEEAATPGDLDQPEILDRPASLQRRGLSIAVGTGLVVVAENHQSDAASTDIADIEHQALGQLALHGKVPVLDVAGLEIGGDVVRADVDLLYVGDREEIVRIALHRRTE